MATFWYSRLCPQAQLNGKHEARRLSQGVLPRKVSKYRIGSEPCGNRPLIPLCVCIGRSDGSTCQAGYRPKGEGAWITCVSVQSGLRGRGPAVLSPSPSCAAGSAGSLIRSYASCPPARAPACCHDHRHAPACRPRLPAVCRRRGIRHRRTAGVAAGGKGSAAWPARLAGRFSARTARRTCSDGFRHRRRAGTGRRHDAGPAAQPAGRPLRTEHLGRRLGRRAVGDADDVHGVRGRRLRVGRCHRGLDAAVPSVLDDRRPRRHTAARPALGLAGRRPRVRAAQRARNERACPACRHCARSASRSRGCAGDCSSCPAC